MFFVVNEVKGYIFKDCGLSELESYTPVLLQTLTNTVTTDCLLFSVFLRLGDGSEYLFQCKDEVSFLRA